MKWTLEEKVKFIKLILGGYPQKRLCGEQGIGRHVMDTWLDRYRESGEEGLKRRQLRELSGQEKEKIVRLYIEKGVPLRSLCNQFKVNRTPLQDWIRKVRNHGYAVLYDKRKRGRPKDQSMARPKKKEPQTELEKLQAENLRLRAENALLKKVKALVEEKKARALQNGHEPSTN